MEKLIGASCDVMGGLFRGSGAIIQLRRPDAPAERRLSNTIHLADLAERTEYRLKYQERLRQQNIEAISQETIRMLPSFCSSDEVDPGWSLQFFEYAQDVCDKGMQRLWAKVLAKEVCQPGSISKRTLQFIKTLNRAEVVLFEKLCCFGFRELAGACFIFRSSGGLYDADDIFTYADRLRGLVDIGLLEPELEPIFTGFSYTDQGSVFQLGAEGWPLDTPLEFRVHRMTAIGSELFDVFNQAEERMYRNLVLEHVHDFVDYQRLGRSA
jgi:hypothetical protein